MYLAVFTISISVYTFVYIFHFLVVIFRGASIGSTDILVVADVDIQG